MMKVPHLLLIIMGFVMLWSYISAISMQSSVPILWRTTNTPLTTGTYEAILRIKLMNPCEIFTKDIVHESLVKEARDRCQQVYERDILNELGAMCPDYHPREILHNSKRKKRFIFTLIIGLIVASVVATVGLGVAGVSMSSINNGKIDSLKEIQAMQDNQLKILTNKYNEQMHRFITLSQDFEQYKAKSIPTQFAIANVLARFSNGRNIILESSRQMKMGKLHPSLLDFFNYTIPCGDDCPIQFASASKCRFMERKELILFFNVPTINRSLQLLEADPFELLVRKENATCRLEYNGPSNVVISKETDCMFPLNVKKYATHDIIFAPSEGCHSHKRPPQENNYFRITQCAPRKESDHLDFIQVKPYHGYNHVYCPESLFTMHGKTVPCPNNVFMLPIQTNFKINDYVYNSQTIHLDHQEQLDPLFTQKANWHLNPNLNMDDLVYEGAVNKGKGTTEDSGTGWTFIILFAIGLSLVTITCVISICICCKSRRLVLQAVEMANRNTGGD